MVGARKICKGVPKREPKTDLDHLKIRSLILLSHAVFEQYFEDLAAEVAKKSLDFLSDESILTLPAFSLISAHKNKFHEIIDVSVSDIVFLHSLLAVGVSALSAHEKVIEENHGIKASNQDKIFNPIGLDTRKLTLRALLDSYGSKRGSVAHTAGIKTIHTRGDIERDIDTILKEIAPFDERAILSSQRHCHAF